MAQSTGTTALSMYRVLAQISTRWPKDSLRPHQLGDAIEASARRAFGPNSSPSSSTIPESTANASTTNASSSSNSGISPILTMQEMQQADSMVSSLERLLANRALEKYPLSEKTIKPASMPEHYEKVREALTKARAGEKPPRFMALRRFFTWR